MTAPMTTDPSTAPASDDPSADTILSLVAALPPGKSIAPEAVARALAEARAKPSDPPDAWRRYLKPVKQQALNLARQGRIVILRKGKPADPRAPIKGAIRLAAPGGEA
jgi:Protein of unknown function (DUF3253)